MSMTEISKTAEAVAIIRAAHQRLPADLRLVDDPVAASLVSPDLEPETFLRQFVADTSPEAQMRYVAFALRERFAEDCLHRAHARGVRQYAIIGAGFDTFAYRQPSWAQELWIVEIDQGVTQDAKRKRLTEANIPMPLNVRFVRGGLGVQSVDQLLREGGLSLDKPTFISMLGVSQYLQRAAFDETVKAVSGLPGGSEIVFSIVLRGDLLERHEAARMARTRSGAEEAGEPYHCQFDPTELRRDLLKMGFREVFHLSPEAANDLYFCRRGDGRRAPLGQQSLCARV